MCQYWRPCTCDGRACLKQALAKLPDAEELAPWYERKRRDYGPAWVHQEAVPRLEHIAEHGIWVPFPDDPADLEDVEAL